MLQRSWRTLIALVSSTLVVAGSAQTRSDYSIGIVPGDIVLGNISNFPGHAGIYVGRWHDLPEDIQTDFASIYEDVLVRSRDVGLADSHLVVDAIGGRGTTLRSFTEQFTRYLPTGARSGRLENALRWEASTGGAVAWPGLGTDDPRRWEIVREALEAARAQVPYEGSHWQWETTNLGTPEERRVWIDGIKTDEVRSIPYSQIRGAFDCITLVHVVYWRGAGIDLDVSWLPWHTPQQLYATAKSENYLRAVVFEELYLDAAILGKWRVEATLVEAWWSEEPQPIEETLLVWVSRASDGSLTLSLVAEDGTRSTDAVTMPGELRRVGDATTVFTLEAGAATGEAMLEIRIGPDGAMDGEAGGVDPPDSDGEGGGRFLWSLTGEKVRDMPVPPRR
jgi:hypothetical protein